MGGIVTAVDVDVTKEKEVRERRSTRITRGSRLQTRRITDSFVLRPSSGRTPAGPEARRC